MLRRLLFTLAYYWRPIWDTGISPPELLNFIATHEAGKALDLGCGTGTNVITLAKAGWQVTGVDFSPQAIFLARRKVRKEKVKVDLRVDDVTRLNSLSDQFDLILDIGCFHSLPIDQHEKYLRNIDRLLSQYGTYMLYVFVKSRDVVGPGVSEENLARISRKLQLIHRQDGMERDIRPSAWLRFQRQDHQ